MNFINDLANLRIIFFITAFSGITNNFVFSLQPEYLHPSTIHTRSLTCKVSPENNYRGFSGTAEEKAHYFFESNLHSVPHHKYLSIVSDWSRVIKVTLISDSCATSPLLYRLGTPGQRGLSSSWSYSPTAGFNAGKKGSHELIIQSYDPETNASAEVLLRIDIQRPAYFKWGPVSLIILLVCLMLFILYKTLLYRYFNTLPAYPVSELLTKEAPKTEIFTPETKTSPTEKSKWEKFEMATVLFSDIQGFTKIAEQMNPEKLIDELDQFFFHFDSVCEKYGIEKIKTIGDAYMAAGGIPVQNSTNPIEVILVALEMQMYMKSLKSSKTDIWDLRIGIHSGPVIGGVMGQKKRSYDIWGDTVNTASRMESSGEPGKVNISGATYSLIKDYFICEYRGRLPVKYKGNIDMYFVKGLRPELSINLLTIPNRVFFLRLQHLRLRDLEKFIFYKLSSELPKTLYFHHFDYIKHLYSHTGILSRAENLTVEEDLLVKTTLLMLFTGLTIQYDSFQNKSAAFAEQILPNYKYTSKQTRSIYNLILYAKMNLPPQNLLEFVIHDILTDFYGRADFIKLYKLLFLEQNENIGKLTIAGFKIQQIELLSHHQYYTLSAKRLQEVPKERQIKNIEHDEWQ